MIVALCLVVPIACQQKMAKQPSYRPLGSSVFFPNGRSSRPLVPHTVPRGPDLRESRLLSGKVQSQDEATRLIPLVGWGAAGALGVLGAYMAVSQPDAEYVTLFPFPITHQVLERGRERFLIYCSVCHGPQGEANGKIVERGYLRPPNYFTDYSRGLERRGFKVPLPKAPAGYYFEVITHGYGGMPDYAAQVAPRDRWNIIAYIRALQLSRHAALADLSEQEREAARQALKGNGEHDR